MKTVPGIDVLVCDKEFGRYLDIALLINGRPALPAEIKLGPEPDQEEVFMQITPWLSLSREAAIKLFVALGEHLKGIKLKDHIELEATLAATEAHLRDVRYLLKLPHPDIIKGGKKA